jgi:hypothetical protein
MTEGQINNMAIYPNPVVDNTATLSYTLEDKSDIEFRLADLQGRVLLSKHKSAQLEGNHYELLNLDGFQQGIFTCTLWINGTHVKTLRVIIK